ncbi:MAG: hypothetical protein HY518_04615 [Candidatus Aenigmarchaeota archaeon]|nr:hypothetical protein [Candidatus Aenigmarchaeota archaeon]
MQIIGEFPIKSIGYGIKRDMVTGKEHRIRLNLIIKSKNEGHGPVYYGNIIGDVEFLAEERCVL